MGTHFTGKMGKFRHRQIFQAHTATNDKTRIRVQEVGCRSYIFSSYIFSYSGFSKLRVSVVTGLPDGNRS